MRAVIQRVLSSSVSVDQQVVSKIGKGYCILLGVVQGDTANDADLLARKISQLRIFQDDAGKMNLSIKDINGDVLVVSQFTLCANLKKGNRPSFDLAAEPSAAQELYAHFLDKLSDYGVQQIKQGVFAASMVVEIINDGPVTIVMDTDNWK